MLYSVFACGQLMDLFQYQKAIYHNMYSKGDDKTYTMVLKQLWFDFVCKAIL